MHHCPRWVLLFVLSTASVWAYAVRVGDNRDAVLKAYGNPNVDFKYGPREVLGYSEGSVILESDRVVEFRFFIGEPKRPVAPSSQRKNVEKQTVGLSRQYRENLPHGQLAQANREWWTWLVWAGIALGGWALVAGRRSRSRRTTVMVPAVRTGEIYCRRPISGGLPTAHSRPMVPIRPPTIESSERPGFAEARLVAPEPAGKSMERPDLDAFSPTISRPVVATTVSMPPRVTRLTEETMQRLEWRRFEELVAEVFRAEGWAAELNELGATRKRGDGGVDIRLSRGGSLRGYVQCKALGSDVGVKVVRELYGVMGPAGVSEGYMVASLGFTDEAWEYERSTHCLSLVTGKALLRRFGAISAQQQAQIIMRVFRDDYITPTCARCGKKTAYWRERLWKCPHCGNVVSRKPC